MIVTSYCFVGSYLLSGKSLVANSKQHLENLRSLNYLYPVTSKHNLDATFGFQVYID